MGTCLCQRRIGKRQLAFNVKWNITLLNYSCVTSKKSTKMKGLNKSRVCCSMERANDWGKFGSARSQMEAQSNCRAPLWRSKAAIGQKLKESNFCSVWETISYGVIFLIHNVFLENIESETIDTSHFWSFGSGSYHPNPLPHGNRKYVWQIYQAQNSLLITQKSLDKHKLPRISSGTNCKKSNQQLWTIGKSGNMNHTEMCTKVISFVWSKTVTNEDITKLVA